MNMKKLERRLAISAVVFLIGWTLITIALSGCGNSSLSRGSPAASYPVQCQVYELNTTLTVVPNLDLYTPNLTVGLYKLNFIEVQELDSFQPFVGTAAENVKTQFAMRCEVKYIATRAGAHKFTLTSDDGSKLYVSGVLTINNDNQHGMTVKTASPTLAVGTYTVRVDYFQNFGSKGLTLTVQEPAAPAVTLP